MINAEFDRERLTHAIAAVNSVQMDSELGFVQIDFTGDQKVVFSSMNHNTSVLYETHTAHEGSGTIKVPGRQLLEYVRTLPQNIIAASVDKPNQLNITCGPSTARIQLVQDQIFTKLNSVENGSTVRLKGELIARWISAFKDFIAHDDFRFYVNGALLWIEKDGEHTKLHSVASDTNRLAHNTIFEDIDITHADGGEVIVPKRVLEELRRIAASEPDKDFTLKWSSQELSFTAEAEGYMLSAKCITGIYPPYQTAFPKSINASIEVDLKLLLNSLKRGLIFANAQDKVVSLKFTGKSLKISGATPGLKEAKEHIELNDPVKHPFEVQYNGHYLVGILALLNGSYATFHWENIDRPVKITGEPERGLASFYLLVPTRY